MYSHSRLIDHILNRERFGHFGEQKLPLTGEDFFYVAVDMVTELLMIDLRRNGGIWCKALLPLLLRMRSSDDALLSDPLRMRSSKKFLVWRSCQIYYTIVKCTRLLSIRLRMRSSRGFLVLRTCQIYHTIVKCTRLLLTLLHSNLIIPRYLRWCAVVWFIVQWPLNLRRSFRIKTGWHPLYAFRHVSQNVNNASSRLRPLDESSESGPTGRGGGIIDRGGGPIGSTKNSPSSTTEEFNHTGIQCRGGQINLVFLFQLSFVSLSLQIMPHFVTKTVRETF